MRRGLFCFWGEGLPLYRRLARERWMWYNNCETAVIPHLTRLVPGPAESYEANSNVRLLQNL